MIPANINAILRNIIFLLFGKKLVACSFPVVNNTEWKGFGRKFAELIFSQIFPKQRKYLLPHLPTSSSAQ